MSSLQFSDGWLRKGIIRPAQGPNHPRHLKYQVVFALEEILNLAEKEDSPLHLHFILHFPKWSSINRPDMIQIFLLLPTIFWNFAPNTRFNLFYFCAKIQIFQKNYHENSNIDKIKNKILFHFFCWMRHFWSNFKQCGYGYSCSSPPQSPIKIKGSRKSLYVALHFLE